MNLEKEQEKMYSSGSGVYFVNTSTGTSTGISHEIKPDKKVYEPTQVYEQKIRQLLDKLKLQEQKYNILKGAHDKMLEDFKYNLKLLDERDAELQVKPKQTLIFSTFLPKNVKKEQYVLCSVFCVKKIQNLALETKEEKLKGLANELETRKAQERMQQERMQALQKQNQNLETDIKRLKQSIEKQMSDFDEEKKRIKQQHSILLSSFQQTFEQKIQLLQ
ncbi:coiled-coil domain containing 57, partial [Reticulomyxa filosa]